MRLSPHYKIHKQNNYTATIWLWKMWWSFSGWLMLAVTHSLWCPLRPVLAERCCTSFRPEQNGTGAILWRCMECNLDNWGSKRMEERMRSLFMRITSWDWSGRSRPFPIGLWRAASEGIRWESDSARRVWKSLRRTSTLVQTPEVLSLSQYRGTSLSYPCLAGSSFIGANTKEGLFSDDNFLLISEIVKSHPFNTTSINSRQSK